MASNIGLLADAIKTSLDAGPFTIQINPVVSYDAEELLSDLGELHVDVVPAAAPFSLVSRSDGRYEAAVDVAIRKRFGTSDQNTDGSINDESITDLMGLLEDINEWLAGSENRRMTTVDATWIGAEIRWPWIPKHLRENRQYTGIVRVTYAIAVTV